MQGIDVWGLISPMISPMTNDAMNNKIMGEAYVKTYIALKEIDKTDELRAWLKKENEFLKQDFVTMARKGYTFHSESDMQTCMKICEDMIKTVAHIIGLDLSE